MAEDNSTLPLLSAIYNTVTGALVSIENIAFVLVICSTPKLRTTRYILTASLCVADLLAGLTTLTFAVIELLSTISDDGTRTRLLTSFGVIIDSMVTLSIAHIAVIAVERYLYIAHPFFYQRRLTPRTIRWTVAILWLMGVAHFSSYVSILTFSYDERPDYFRDIPVVLLACYAWTPYVCGMITTCVFYGLILCQVRKHGRSIENLGGTTRHSRLNEVVRSLRFFLTVFGIYLLMTSPLFITEAVAQFTSVNLVLQTSVQAMCILNSCMTGLILFFVDRQFRQILKSKVGKFKKWIKRTGT